jgi:hypothetical protein
MASRGSVSDWDIMNMKSLEKPFENCWEGWKIGALNFNRGYAR